MVAGLNGGMFGMINHAIEDFALRRGGPIFWEEVRRVAGVTHDFQATTPYPDELTFRLVWAASQLLGIPIPKLLRIVGKHGIVERTCKIPLGEHCLSSFFMVLSELQAQITQTMAHLAVLRCIHEEEGHLWVEYRSPRLAVGPFVVGILEGIAAQFQVDLLIDHVVRAGEGSEFDAFRIHLKPVATP